MKRAFIYTGILWLCLLAACKKDEAVYTTPTGYDVQLHDFVNQCLRYGQPNYYLAAPAADRVIELSTSIRLTNISKPVILESLDKEAPVNPGAVDSSSVYCPGTYGYTIPIGTRQLPPFATAYALLKTRIAEASNNVSMQLDPTTLQPQANPTPKGNSIRAVDSMKVFLNTLHLCRAWVNSVFSAGGEQDASYPGFALWDNMPLQRMYEYGAGDSGQIQCGNRTKTMEKLLNTFGYTSFVELSFTGVHTFPCVKGPDGLAYLADGYNLWVPTVNGAEVDIVSYFRAARHRPFSVVMMDLPPSFGVPESLLATTYDTLAMRCGTWEDIVTNPDYAANVDPSWNTGNIAQWLPSFLAKTVPGSSYHYKAKWRATYADWIAHQTQAPASCPLNPVTFWTCTDIPLVFGSYTGSDPAWSLQTQSNILFTLGR